MRNSRRLTVIIIYKEDDMKRHWLSIIAFILLFTLLAGCTGGGATTPAPTQAPAAATAAPTAAAATATPAPAAPAEPEDEPTAPIDGLEWRLITEPITMTIFIDGLGGDWAGWGSDPITEEITKITGVTIDVKHASTSSHEELNSMLASGTLPDFIKIWEPNLRTTLWKQEFLLPLNELMDKYAPNMWSIIPTDMDTIYTESDGNLYFFASGYCDIPRIEALPYKSQTTSGTTVNVPAFEELGSPQWETLDDYKDVLLRVKNEMGDRFPYLVFEVTGGSPQDGQRNMAQLFNRIYGGDAVKAIGSDGKVRLNFQDDEYRKAILYLNDLYRNGLINKEMFTLTTGEQRDPIFRNQQCFSFWGQPFNSFRFDTSAEGPYQGIEPPKEPGITPIWMSNLTGIGSPDTAITSNCKDPERAILYLQYLMSDEGQILTYHGREGIDFVFEEGMPRNLPEKQAMWTQNFSEVQSKMGIINYSVTWISTVWTDQLYYYWMHSDQPAYKISALINNKYARNERINMLLLVESDKDEKVIETQIFDLWVRLLPQMYCADTEAASMAALDELISGAKSLGLDDLEAEYSRIYTIWKDVVN